MINDYKAITNFVENINNEKELAIIFNAIEALFEDIVVDDIDVINQIDQTLLIISRRMSKILTADKND